jgi:ribosomal protein S12 methylthiotransferase accessory factor
LISGGPIWVPAVMACYRLVGAMESERFWYRISTGFSIHTDPFEAIVGGICELAERDLNAIMWLQRLQLPSVPSDRVSETARVLLGWSTEHFINTYLFDGTTDIGVPTVYCVQIAQHDVHARQVVGAGTARDMATAAEKALMEAIAARSVFHSESPVRTEFSEFREIDDGARYMGRPEMASAFDFLINGAESRIGPERPTLPDDPAEALACLIQRLSLLDMQAIAVDRTSAELRAAGLSAVSIIIPDLQPMTLHPLAQYRAHRRLYELPMLMGHASHSEENLNSCPQPFH